MRRGLLISASMHLALIALAVLQFDLFERDEAQAIQISEVSLISGAEFDAAVSSAPPAPRVDIPEMQAPEAGGSEVTAPDAGDMPSTPRPDAPEQPEQAEAETPPDMTALRSAEPPRPAPDAPEQAEAPAADDGAVALVTPDMVGPAVDPSENRKPEATTLDRPAPPAPAPRIASRPAPKPPADAETAEEAAPEVAEAESPEDPVVEEERPAEAPAEAATEIVPEVAEADPEPEAVAPLTAPRPRTRPEAPTRTAEAEPAQLRQTPPSQQAPAAPAREASTPAPARAASNVPVGPPLTGREKDGITLPVKQNWNLGPIQGRPDFRELVVTVQFDLDQSGNVVGKEVRPVSPSRPSGAFELAFRQARIAILKSAPFRMPPDKYGQWKTVEITFNPSNGIGY